MRRTGHLFEQVTDFGVLREAARRAARGTRSLAAAEFLADLEANVLHLQRELLERTYEPGPFTTFQLRDPKPRTISAAPFRDRVVHHAVCSAMEPTFERYAVFDSYACRPGKGNRAAMRRAQGHARHQPWFAKLDVQRFFETLPHDVLLGLLRRRFKDRRLLALVGTVLAAGATKPGVGLPIGNLTSQHFANFALGALDHHALEVVRVGAWVRYMDDMLLFGPDRHQVRRSAHAVEAFLSDELRLALRHDATVVAPVRVGIPFLGFRVWPRQVRLDGARVRRLRRRLRALDRLPCEEERARSAESLIAWTEQADTLHLRRALLERG